MSITVLLADDHAVVREGLRAILGAERDVRLVGEAADGQEALRLAERGPADPYDALTPREREVLQLTAEGYTGAAIAEKLFISPRTVETHRAHVMHKLGLKNQKEMVRYALQRRPPPAGPGGEKNA